MHIFIHKVNTIEKLSKVPKEFGVEIDTRAEGNNLVLNHDPHKNGDDLERFLRHYNHSGIIFHVKDSGIEKEVIGIAKKFGIDNYFLHESEPPFLFEATRKIDFKKLAVRFSEFEPIEFALSFSGYVKWVWIDVNTTLPLNRESYIRLKDAGFKLCLVCPGTLGRPEDILKYKKFMHDNDIQIDAIMTELEDAEKWVTG